MEVVKVVRFRYGPFAIAPSDEIYYTFGRIMDGDFKARVVEVNDAGVSVIPPSIDETLVSRCEGDIE